jgi:non-specific serine/threonine protein kinase
VPTQTTGQPRDNLPAKVTRFIGRKRELSAVTQAIDEHRLVTLRGAGGVGKSRLALAVAAGFKGAHGHQVRLVELSALRSPELLPAEVARALGRPGLAPSRPAEAPARQLAEPELLLLDTCEHLLAACAALIPELLDSCPSLRILATSREPFGITGEHVVPIPPLAADSPQSDAVELFLDRARAEVPGYSLTAANTRAVVALCRELEGMPLAIELAAVRLRSMSAQEILSRLDDRFRILGTSRTATDRHRTLRAAVRWSYDLCTPAEQRLWARLSVFLGGFTARAAEAVCGPGTAETLDRLARKSVISAREPGDQETAGPGAPGWYTMPDTMREFGAALLTASDSADARRKHRDYFLALAERAAEGSAGREQASWLSLVRQTAGNLQAALDYSFGTPGEEQAGLRLTRALLPYWVMLGALSEGRRWLDRALAASPGPHENARACYGAGFLAAQQGDLGAARPLLNRAAVLARQLQDPELAACVTWAQGSVALHAGDNELALDCFGAALARFEESGFDGLLLLACYVQLASACLVTFDLARAIALSEECARRCEDAGEQWARGAAMWVRGAARWLAGDTDRAIQDALRSLQVTEALGALRMTTMCVDLIAVCLATRAGTASAASASAASTADLERAAKLRGAGDTMWDVLNVPVMAGPAYAEIRADAAAKCRNALGDERFEAARRRGMELSQDEAIALARGEAPDFVPAGPRPLTRREREIAALVAKGLANREIAGKLFLSKRTIDSHIEHIFGKLGFNSRTQLAGWVAEAGSQA